MIPYDMNVCTVCIEAKPLLCQKRKEKNVCTIQLSTFVMIHIYKQIQKNILLVECFFKFMKASANFTTIKEEPPICIQISDCSY
jgi:hypothetical protein